MKKENVTGAIISGIVTGVVTPLTLLLLPVVIAIASKIVTGSWTSFIYGIPVTAWALFLLLILFWLGFNISRSGRSSFGVGILTLPRIYHEWQEVGVLEYAEVKWRVKSPKLGLSEKFDPSMIRLELPPRCPTCGTKLTEHRAWGKYVWNCVGCGLRKKNKKNFLQTSEDAEKLAQRHIEEDIEQREG